MSSTKELAWSRMKKILDDRIQAHKDGIATATISLELLDKLTPQTTG